MIVFILGGTVTAEPAEAQTLNAFCRKLGVALGNSDHRIVLCSCHPSSADRGVLDGLAASSGRSIDSKLIVHRPDDTKLREEWQTATGQLGLATPEFHDHRGPYFRIGPTGQIDKVAIQLAYLLCQIRAVQECDVVATVGGHDSGSAALTLAIARDTRAIILPYRFLGGVAEQTFLRLEENLRTRLNGGDIDKLCDPDAGAGATLSLIDKLGGVRRPEAPRVFLSYPWTRSDYADLVEAVLRRHDQVTVFRDERDIDQGESISDRIQDEIKYRCDLFIAIWGREYVQSPFCHDEMELWMQHRRSENLFLLRFDETRPVWPWLRSSGDNREAFRVNWPLLGKERGHIELAIRKLLETFERRVGVDGEKAGAARKQPIEDP